MPLNHISPSFFSKSTTLKIFDLSDNFLQDISHLIFESLANLSKINISGNILSDMNIRTYQSLRLTKFMIVDRGGLCCIAKHAYNCIVNSTSRANSGQPALWTTVLTYMAPA